MEKRLKAEKGKKNYVGLITKNRKSKLIDKQEILDETMQK